MSPLLIALQSLLGGMVHRTRDAWRGRDGQSGASTLELVILILGLVTVATLLVAALTAAVRSRTDQIT